MAFRGYNSKNHRTRAVARAVTKEYWPPERRSPPTVFPPVHPGAPAKSAPSVFASTSRDSMAEDGEACTPIETGGSPVHKRLVKNSRRLQSRPRSTQLDKEGRTATDPTSSGKPGTRNLTGGTMRNKLNIWARLSAAFLLANVAFAPDASATQTCVWRGTAPFCAGKCKAGEKGYERGLSGYAADGGADCVTGSKILCCSGEDAKPCPSGLVWRERFDGDTVCVTPAERDANRRARGLPATCVPGLVWRERFDGDTVCVTPAERDANRRARGLPPVP